MDTKIEDSLLSAAEQIDHSVCFIDAGKEDHEKTGTPRRSVDKTYCNAVFTAVAGLSILVLLEMSIIFYVNKPTTNNQWYDVLEQESRLLTTLEQEEGETTRPSPPEEHYQINGVETDKAAIEKVVNICTATAAVSILCNLIVLFLTFRTRKESDEESHQPIYQRVMSTLAISGTLVEANFFVAGISGSMFNVMTLKLSFQDDGPGVTKSSESISFGCYMQAFVDTYFYIVYIFCCAWLCIYFLLKLNYGIARISKCAEVSAYLIIFLLAFGYVSFLYMDGGGGTVAPVPSYGVCLMFSQSFDYYLLPMFLGVVLLLGILSMLLIIYKTFRDEQEINRMNSIQQGIQPSQRKFEATKDIAIQAFALMIFLFFGFYLQVFALYQTGFVYDVTTLIVYISQGVYNLTLYFWFEMRNMQKQFPDINKKDIFLSIFNHDLDSEPRCSQVVSTEEQTPLMVDRKRCLVDMTFVENDMCEGVLRDLDEIDRKVDKEGDEEIARQRQAKREEEARRQKLQAENMQMHSGAYTSVKDMEDFQKLMLSSFDDMKQDLADRKQKHNNSLRDSNVPVRLRYGSIDPSTFRIDVTEKEIDNLSADGTRDPSTMQPGEVKLAQIQEEEDGEADTKKKAKEDSVASSQDLSGLEERAFEDDEDDNVAAGAAPPSGYTVISDLTSRISTLRF